MTTSAHQQVSFQPLSELLPKNEAGDVEFEQIVSVLLGLDEAQLSKRRQGVTPTRIGPGMLLTGRTLCVYRLPSQKSNQDADDRLLGFINEKFKGLELHRQPTRFVVVDPSATAATKLPASDSFQRVVETVRRTLPLRCTMTLWDAAQLKDRLLAVPPFGLRYYPELLLDGPKHWQAIAATRQRYDQEFTKLHGKIQFVGMSVYKEEASASVDMTRSISRSGLCLRGQRRQMHKSHMQPPSPCSRPESAMSSLVTPVQASPRSCASWPLPEVIPSLLNDTVRRRMIDYRCW